MIFMLDTNACIAYLRRPLSPLAQRILATPPSDITMSTVTLAELFRGAHLSAKVAENLMAVDTFIARFTILSLNQPAAMIAGQIDAELAKQGLRIGPYDTLIAAIALANHLTLVTRNTSEFGRIPGLRLQNWEATTEQ